MSNIIDSIQLSGITYTIQGGGDVDSAVTSGSTNAVAGGAVFDKVTISTESEEFISSAQSTSSWDWEVKVFPSGTTKFTLTNFGTDEITKGGSSIDIYDSTDTKVSTFYKISTVDPTYTTVDGAVGDALISFTANDGYYFKGSSDNGIYLNGATVISFYRLATTSEWLKDIVSANTAAIDGKQDISGMTAYTQTSAFTAHTADTTAHTTSEEKSFWNGAVTALGGMTIIKLTQAQYDALDPDYDSDTLYVIVN